MKLHWHLWDALPYVLWESCSRCKGCSNLHVLEHLGIAFRLYFGYNQHQFCAVFELLKNHSFWFLKIFKIRESPASVFWKHQNQRTICPSYFKNLQLTILSLVIEDNGILLASLSHICKNRDKNTQCFNVS